MSDKDVHYTRHALRRARERKLWKYVSKEKFFYDAQHVANNKAQLDECIYVYKYLPDNTIIILTMHGL